MGGMAVARFEPWRFGDDERELADGCQAAPEGAPQDGRLSVVDTVVVEPHDSRLVRLFDVVVAAAALVGLFPLIVVLGALVRCTSPGPVVFRHERLGRLGRPFLCLKFRTMVDGAEYQLPVLLREDAALRQEFESNFKLAQDPRVTPVGRFLRATSLDELPQLINVLRGEMSIVGPRPIVEAEAVRYGSRLATVLSVKPGMTGLWQVSGRSQLSYEERVQLDVDYTRRRSLRGDLNICLRTLRMMAPSSGAY